MKTSDNSLKLGRSRGKNLKLQWTQTFHLKSDRIISFYQPPRMIKDQQQLALKITQNFRGRSHFFHVGVQNLPFFQ